MDERKQECEDGCYSMWDGCAPMGQSEKFSCVIHN